MSNPSGTSRRPTIEEMTKDLKFDGKERDYLLDVVMENGAEETYECRASKPEDFNDFVREQQDDDERDDPYAPSIAYIVDIREDIPEKVRRMSQDSSFTINNSYGDEKVSLSVASYYHGGGMYVGLTCAEGEDAGAPFGDATKNLGVTPPPFHAYIDTNNMRGLERMLVENDIAEPTGETLRSGYCEYPLMKFRKEALERLDPEGVANYEEVVGKNPAKTEKPDPSRQEDFLTQLGLPKGGLDEYRKNLGESLGE